MPCIDLPQGTIHYSEDGPRDAPVIVLLHGVLVDGQLWRKLVPELCAEHRVVVPDLPLGCHRTPLNPGADRSPAGVAALVAAFLEALDLREVTLVGNDTGGAIAQLVAADHPERLARLCLVACDAFENFPPGLFGPLFPIMAARDRLLGLVLAPVRWRATWRLPVTYGWVAKRPIDEPVVRAWTTAMRAGGGIRADLGAFLRSVEPAVTLGVAERLPAFTRPVLVLWAREDRFFPSEHAERLAALFDDARVRWIEDSYAFVSEDQPIETAAAIKAFLEETAIASAAAAA